MSRKNNRDGGLVFSTEQGRTCPLCRQSSNNCCCREKTVAADSDGIVRVSRETKGRKGKGVTKITGLMLAPEALSDLALLMKKKCGGGGSIKDGVIEIQGDHRQVLMAELRQQGYQVKCVGG